MNVLASIHTNSINFIFVGYENMKGNIHVQKDVVK
ncbi:hypothetical protein PARMER_01178 [Parabacteroides merdae ATCC 43184]|nr:hypothetical protein PARMER_01178 [Parabacteroides merdae ATCC 43184]